MGSSQERPTGVGSPDESVSRLLYGNRMEIYSTFWTFATFTFNVLVAIVGFGLIQRSQKQMLEQMR
jgi:hypothetical protein